jgi:hypothetical protein
MSQLWMQDHVIWWVRSDMWQLEELSQMSRKYKVLYDPEMDRVAPLEEEDRALVTERMQTGAYPAQWGAITRRMLRYGPEMFQAVVQALYQTRAPLEQVRLAVSFVEEATKITAHIPFQERVRSLGAWYRRTYLRLPLDAGTVHLPTCYDFVEMEEVSVGVYLAQDPGNLILVQTSPTGVRFATGSNKTTIIQTTNSFYVAECPQAVDTDTVLYQLQGRFPVYVHSETLSALLLSPSRLFRVCESTHVYPLTIGVDTYHGRNSPFDVGLDHCTPGTDKRLSTLSRM